MGLCLLQSLSVSKKSIKISTSYVFYLSQIKVKMRFRSKRVCSSAWLERTPDKGEVGGSSPPRPTNLVNYS